MSRTLLGSLARVGEVAAGTNWAGVGSETADKDALTEAGATEGRDLAEAWLAETWRRRPGQHTGTGTRWGADPEREANVPARQPGGEELEEVRILRDEPVDLRSLLWTATPVHGT